MPRRNKRLATRSQWGKHKSEVVLVRFSVLPVHDVHNAIAARLCDLV
jgi:hypothetical protein